MRAKATHIGSCQKCGHVQKLPNGKLAKHGYDVRWGFFNGVCSAAEELPYEQSCELIKGYIQWAEGVREDIKEHIAEELKPATEPKGWYHECGAPMSGLRAADNKLQGVHTFYVESTSGKEYVVQYVRRGHKRFFACNCPDFTFRQLPLGRLCKHAKALKLLAKEYHGISKLAKAARRRSGYVIPADSALHHINGDIHDNRPENLRVVNLKENMVTA